MQQIKSTETPTSELAMKFQRSTQLGNKEGPITWAGRAFKALDRENRGYLFKHELLDHIKKSGVYSHH